VRREAVCREEILGYKVAQKRPAPAGQRFMPCRAVTNLDWQAGVVRMTWGVRVSAVAPQLSPAAWLASGTWRRLQAFMPAPASQVGRYLE